MVNYKYVSASSLPLTCPAPISVKLCAAPSCKDGQVPGVDVTSGVGVLKNEWADKSLKMVI